MTEEEREQLEKIKDALHEDKDSTAMKQAALKVAAILLFDDKMRQVVEIAVANYRRAHRTGRLRKVDL